MSHIRVLICRVDEPEQMTELTAFDLGALEKVRLDAAHRLEDLEAQTHRIGNRIPCRLLQAQWNLIDAQLTEQYMEGMAPTKVQRDSREPLKVARRFGLVVLSRQICTEPETQRQRQWAFSTVNGKRGRCARSAHTNSAPVLYGI